MTDLPGWVWLLWTALWALSGVCLYTIGWHAGGEGMYERGYEDGTNDAGVDAQFWDMRERPLEPFDFED